MEGGADAQAQGLWDCCTAMLLVVRLPGEHSCHSLSKSSSVGRLVGLTHRAHLQEEELGSMTRVVSRLAARQTRTTSAQSRSSSPAHRPPALQASLVSKAVTAGSTSYCETFQHGSEGHGSNWQTLDISKQPRSWRWGCNKAEL